VPTNTGATPSPILQKQIDDYSKVTSCVMAAKLFEERVTNQSDTSLHGVGHLRDLSDIAVKANVTVIDILNGRITEAFDELKAVFAEPSESTP